MPAATYDASYLIRDRVRGGEVVGLVRVLLRSVVTGWLHAFSGGYVLSAPV
ncbi:hypothetical protein SAMN04488570_2441 [Nocardioides scoriae]|uniref:Uncharacterized protein n=1 Tax=Nocardioides scoriae TaxID=642780 RepID=A0A1H1U7G0_9ACTN|nr:hypothetical protein SAMN04488570_2441 [Nocardioides scoriae]